MTAHARLALIENLSELLHGEFAVGQQKQDAQARALTHRAQSCQELFHHILSTISWFLAATRHTKNCLRQHTVTEPSCKRVLNILGIAKALPCANLSSDT
ncbi:MAG: hypothetical protein AAGF81_22275, partial [Pseudomonadota bacterium]